MPYLLDTNHCSYIIDGNVQVLNRLNNQGDDVIGISIITYAELLYMADKSARKSENITVVKEFLEQVDLYFLDEETAIFYGVFMNQQPTDRSHNLQQFSTLRTELLWKYDQDAWCYKVNDADGVRLLQSIASAAILPLS